MCGLRNPGNSGRHTFLLGQSVYFRSGPYFARRRSPAARQVRNPLHDFCRRRPDQRVQHDRRPRWLVRQPDPGCPVRRPDNGRVSRYASLRSPAPPGPGRRDRRVPPVQFPVSWPQTGQRFPGDAGSYFLGFSVLYAVILLSQGQNRAMPPVSALWFCLLPLLDMGGISIRRVLKRRSPFQADREHLHHIFTLAKFSAAATTGAMALVALLGVMVGTTLAFAGVSESIMLVLFLGTAALYLWRLIYTWKSLLFLRRSIDRRFQVADRRTRDQGALPRITDRRDTGVTVEGANDPEFERRAGRDRRARAVVTNTEKSIARGAAPRPKDSAGLTAPPGG